jgi:hypothetical protein
MAGRPAPDPGQAADPLAVPVPLLTGDAKTIAGCSMLSNKRAGPKRLETSRDGAEFISFDFGFDARQLGTPSRSSSRKSLKLPFSYPLFG